jgi:peptidoglycan/xylan/chitin deacetylase (PgdA/CDA1 family)
MKVVSVLAGVMCWISLIGFTGCSRSKMQDQTPVSLKRMENFHWPKGKRAAISLSFDDARSSQLSRGMPILDEYGAKATFFVLIEPMEKQLDGWKKAIANGHEIGNHSLVHPCSGNFPFSRDRALEDYTLEQMRRELRQANDTIEDLLGTRPVSFAYPCGQKYVGRGRDFKSYVPLVAELFLTGRGWMDEWANDPAFCDMANLMGVELDGKSFEQVKSVMDRTLADGGWLIFCGHEIGDGGRQTTLATTLQQLCEYAHDPANGVWLESVGTIARYINKQRLAAHASEFSAGKKSPQVSKLMSNPGSL